MATRIASAATGNYWKWSIAEPEDGPREWTLLGWGKVAGARLSHLWRYHPGSGLLKSHCRLILRYGNPRELLNAESAYPVRCKQCKRHK